jgi:hypothetical protein
MDDLIRTFSERGDLAHLALFLWAMAATALLTLALRELIAAMRRFDDFVRELARFNQNFGGRDGNAASRAARPSRRAKAAARSPDRVSRIPGASRPRRKARRAAARREGESTNEKAALRPATIVSRLSRAVARRRR